MPGFMAPLLIFYVYIVLTFQHKNKKFTHCSLGCGGCITFIIDINTLSLLGDKAHSLYSTSTGVILPP